MPYTADGEAADWLGVTLIFADVGWKDGVTAHYVGLDAASGVVRTAIPGLGLWGIPATVRGATWACLAAEKKARASCAHSASRSKDRQAGGQRAARCRQQETLRVPVLCPTVATSPC